MAFHHVVMFRWNDTATDDQRQAIAQALGTLPGAIPELRGYRFGSDAGLAPGNWDFAVAADFEDQGDYETYRDHPLHRAVIADHIAPALAERVAVQFSTTHDG